MKNKLELMWVGKYDNKEIEPRILIEQRDKNYGDDKCNNILIHGDNLLALKALEKDYAGKIDCVYIDPPYNTGNAFESYDDGIEHSIWLNLMFERLKLLRILLSEKGVICVQIDHSPNSRTTQSPEMGYLQLLMDEVFGRKNYITNLIWKKKGNASNTAITIGTITESIFVYAKDKSKATINKEAFEKKYKFSDQKGNYNLSTFLKTDSGDYERKTMKFEIIDNSTGKKYLPPEGKRWTYGKDSIDKFNAEGMLVFKDDKVYVKEYEKEENTKLFKNLLLEHGSLKSAKDELQKLGFPREGFPTPKPEILIQEILKMFTNEGDLVLDSFLGSGTTAAVAMKMNRRWIGIELGEHCYTYCKMRLDKVIDGEQGGISKDNNWRGGSGYKFYELAPTLINEDKFGEPVINSKYSPEMLASAVALHEGFEYRPSNTEFWKQSIGSENSYLYVTTKFINESALDEIVKSMKNNEYLIIACSAYDKQIEKKYKNIKIKKIPEMLLTKCQFGVDNYDLNIINPPEYDEEEE